MTDTHIASISIIDTITAERDRLASNVQELTDSIEADIALRDQNEAELNRASAALAVFQTTPAPKVRAGFLTGRRG